MIKNIDINHTTTVYELLVAYPELEDVLIDITPVFIKLKNPILRNTIAKVATLKHASIVGGVELRELISVLRNSVGLGDVKSIDQVIISQEYLGSKPEWFIPEKIISSIDESKLSDLNKMPITLVLKKAKNIKDREIIEWVTTFLPAPGIDLMQKKGYETWTRKENDNQYKSYFRKKEKTNTNIKVMHNHLEYSMDKKKQISGIIKVDQKRNKWEFIISFESKNQLICSINIFNSSGEVVYSNKIESNRSHKVDFKNNQPSGLYSIRIFNKEVDLFKSLLL